MSNNLLTPNALIRDAQFAVNWRQAEILKAKIRVDFTGALGDQKELDRHLRELEIERNYLEVLTEKLGESAQEKPAIVKWALGE